MPVFARLFLLVVLGSMAASAPRSTAAQSGYLYYTESGNTITITGAASGGWNGIIPATIAGKAVTTIGHSAFFQVKTLNQVTLPASITRIENYAFRGSSVRAINLPANLQFLGYESFKECTGLTEVTLPASLTSIGYDSFLNCTSLAKVTLSTNLARLGVRTFAGCIALKTIQIPQGMISLGSDAFVGSGIGSFTVPAFQGYFRSDGGILFSGTSIFLFPPARNGSYTIPQGTTSIQAAAFSGCNKLTGVTIPSSVTTIGDLAFNGCSSLAAITIPSSVKTIGDYAFSSCTALKHIAIPATVTTSGYSLFSGSGLVTVSLPTGLKTIEYAMFNGCRSLKSVKIPAGVTRIDDYAFEDCRALVSVDLPAGLLSIGDSSFASCEALPGIKLPVSLETLEDSAFAWCRALKTVEIPAATTSIHPWSFSQCTVLTAITVHADNPAFRSESGLLLDHSGETLIACPSGKKGRLVVPAGVKAIGESAAHWCPELTEVIFPDSLEKIEPNSFSWLPKLTRVWIPAKVTEIGYSAFTGSGLTEVIFAGNAPTLGNQALGYNGATFKVKFFDNRSGFTIPTWNGYQAVSMGTDIPDAPLLTILKADGTAVESGSLALDFGKVLAPGNGKLTFFLENRGAVDAAGLSAVKGGTHEADFRVTGVFPARLAAGERVGVEVVFTPQGTATRSGWLELSSDHEIFLQVSLKGTGGVTTPEIEVMQPAGSSLKNGSAKKTFGTAPVGKKGGVKKFMIRNTGSAPLTGLAISKNGRHSSDFIVTALPTTTLAPGASMTFKVTFKPTKKGTRSAAIRIRSNDADENPFEVKLSGAGANG